MAHLLTAHYERHQPEREQSDAAQQGRKAFQLQRVAAAHAENVSSSPSLVAKVFGFRSKVSCGGLSGSLTAAKREFGLYRGILFVENWLNATYIH